MIVLGIGCIGYPTAASWYSAHRQRGVADSYVERASYLSKERVEEEWEKARMYNAALSGLLTGEGRIAGSGYTLPDNYEEVLNIDGIMGRLSIPEITVDLPIYHGVDEEKLKKGIGHLEGSALPIGSGGHAYLTGHTGLADAKLLTELEKLEREDTFYITILNRTFTYEVNRIEVIEPEEFDLYENLGENAVTLITCTPYGVNSHRLLVTGRLTSVTKDGATQAVESIPRATDSRWLFLAAGAAGLLLAAVVTGVIVRKRKRRADTGGERTGG